MHVFVTGATGFIGSVIVQELLDAGHQVTGLVRSDAGAQKLAQTGAKVLRGDLEDTGSLQKGAAEADAVIHTAFIHDFSRFNENCETDRRAIEAMGGVLRGTGKLLIVTSGIALLGGHGAEVATEHTAVPANSSNPRRASDEAALALAAQGVHINIMRLPPSVHDAGDHGFVPMLIDLARRKGEAAYVGDGENLWPAVHRRDAAKLYRLALDKNEAMATYHAISEEGVPFRRIAGTISRNLGVPVSAKSGDDAAAYFEWFLHFAALNTPASSAITRETLGWKPVHKGLLADVDSEAYFPPR